jgi:hypothetical protein
MKHVSLVSQLASQDGTALLHKLQLLASMLLNKNAISCALNTLPESEARLTTEAGRFFSRFYGNAGSTAHVPAGSGRPTSDEFHQAKKTMYNTNRRPKNLSA